MTSFQERAMFCAVTAGLILVLLSGCSAENPEAMIASAKRFVERHDDKAAIIQLKNALQKAPESAEARYLLGNALLETGDPVAAEMELRKARERNYSSERVVPRLARAMLASGESDKLVKEFAATQLADPDAIADLEATVGYAYLNLRRPKEAQEAFSAALAVKPDHAQAILGEARLKAASMDLAGAATLVNGILEKSPGLIEALFLKAELLLAANDPVGAGKVYEKILEAHPEAVAAHYSRVMLSLVSQQLDTAAWQLAAMRKVAPHSLQTEYLQTLLLLKRKEWPAAREAAQQVLKIAPNFLPGQLVAGEIEYHLKSYPQAEAHLQKVLAAAPGNVSARRMLSAAYLRDGQPSRALEVLTPLLSDRIEDSGLLMLAGEVYLNNNDMVQAEKYLAKAVAQDKGNAAARTRFGQMLFASGKSAAGMHELEAAVELDSTQYQADVLLIVAHMRRNEADKALAAIATLEKKQPENPLTHYLRAAAMLMKGDMAACRGSLEHALKLDPVYFPAALTLAKLDVQDKKWDMAKQRFEKILEKNPKNPQALLALAQVRVATGAPSKEAIEPIDRAVSGNPTNIEARLAQIRHYMSSGEPKKATAVAQEALAAIPDSPAILDALGVAQQAAGEINQAVATFSKLVALRPKSPEPLLRLASVELADKRSDVAMQSLHKALVLNPDLLEPRIGLIVSMGYLLEGDIYAQQGQWTEAAAAYRGGLNKLHSGDLAAKLYGATIAGDRTADADKFAAEWIRANPKDITFRAYLAGRSLDAKEYAVAARQYRTLLAIDPRNPLILNNLAWVAGQIKDPKAIDYAEQANALRPNEPAILDTLGMLLVDKGEAARGLGLLRQATDLAPNAWAIRVNLVKTLAKVWQKDAARKELDPLLKLDETNPARAAATEVLKAL